MKNGDRESIDVHVHILAVAAANGARVCPKMRRSLMSLCLGAKYGWRGDDEAFDRAYAERLAREIRESKTTDRAVVLAFDGVYDSSGALDSARTSAYIPNEYCLKLCERHPEFIFGASVNPARADALDELDRVAANGAALIKWVANSQDINPAEPSFIPFYRKMAELKLPLLSHTGYEHCVKTLNHAYGDPKLLRVALDEGVTVIAAHAGTSGIGHPIEYFDDYLAMLDEYPNLWGDLGAVTGITRFKYIPAMLAREGFTGRCLQATDYPAPPIPALFVRSVGVRRALGLSMRRNIFDKDVELKRALGFPDDILYNAAGLLPEASLRPRAITNN
ncbi:MAG TPA: amidohydrolase family protein [bacterium]|nr:amidohydrolase family protein [bacterium]